MCFNDSRIKLLQVRIEWIMHTIISDCLIAMVADEQTLSLHHLNWILVV